MRHISLRAPLNAGARPIGTGLPSSRPTWVALMGDTLTGEARP